ncbi:SEC-C metal-binding domain-containing protein [Amycolatopsis sp. NBC_01488]|uniref:SEC-C metal-binding domain-containing protein n=1 Tax=Amycolatopsis sp. NBC_01488 TaxID=2903563 RepID=UPI002E29BE6B|nr:SEC-C metal-binding domain-containing protein [Amycolatopsis sp. NBC_01488]
MVATSLADSPLVDVIAAVLAERGPMAEEQLIAALCDGGVALDDDPEEALIDALEDGEGLLTVLADGRWASAPALLTGRVFTHRLTGPEVEHGVLGLEPDLTVIETLVRRAGHQRLTDGSPVVPVFPDLDGETPTERGVPPEAIADGGALLLPPGWLRERGLSEGDVVALRVAEDGLLLEAGTGEAIPEDRPAALGRALKNVLAESPDRPVELHSAVWAACASDRALFTEPLLPLREALAACGLAYDDEWLAPAGFDFRRWRAGVRRTTIARQHGLDDEAAFAVLAILTYYEKVAESHAAASESLGNGVVAAGLSAAVSRLAEVPIAEAVLAEIPATDLESAAALEMFAETLEETAPRAARPALWWLRGKAHERLGDVAAAQAAYETAESLDPQWSPALYALARFAGERGDAVRGLALLRRADTPPDDILVELLERFQAEPRSDVGRNDPCWCGSGRKYKKCHLHGEMLTLDERAQWLYQKAGLFLDDGPWSTAMLAAAEARAEFSADDPYAVLDALDDPLTADAVLFEGGAFAEFVAVRGGLLPEDERLLAEQWLLVERSVFEIEQVRPGEGCTVRDVRTGDVHQVNERIGSLQLKTGMLICARVVPTGETEQIFGGIEPVALHERDALIALLDSSPDPITLISFLSRRFAPPVLENAEGDPLVLCEVTLRTDDPAALAAELDETYERDDDTWHEYVTTNGTKRIRATLRLDGHELTVHANSDARIDRVLTVLRKLDPKLTVVNESRQPAQEAVRSSSFAESPPPSVPEAAAILDQFIRDYEQKWLDEPIPALAGHTPRQAAADPTRRDDLIRLLGSFPDTHGEPGAMDPDRLRAALGLQ